MNYDSLRFIIIDYYELRYTKIQFRSKIRVKHNNLVIYRDVLVNFLRILSTKSTISHKLIILNIGKIFFDRFQNIAHLFGSKTQFGQFWGSLTGISPENIYNDKKNTFLKKKSIYNFSTKIYQLWKKDIFWAYKFFEANYYFFFTMDKKLGNG